MANFHICDVSINWPDEQWEEETEKEYLVRCLRHVANSLEERKAALSDERDMHFLNTLGRAYATVKLSKIKNPARPGRNTGGHKCT